MQELTPSKSRCSLVKKTAFDFILFFVLREGNQTRLDYPEKYFNCPMNVGYFLPVILFMTCEERLNLCMNCASMDCDRWIMYNEIGRTSFAS